MDNLTPNVIHNIIVRLPTPYWLRASLTNKKFMVFDACEISYLKSLKWRSKMPPDFNDFTKPYMFE